MGGVPDPHGPDDTPAASSREPASREPASVTDRFDPIATALSVVHGQCRHVTGGEVASYIPELADADPEWFGLSLASVTSHRYDAGDAEVPFTIQSISKPFTYALAVSDLGLDAVHQRVGAEPSGDAFNAISLDPDTGRPDNPMINAGAIVVTSLVAGEGFAERFERIRQRLSGFAGRPLAVDEAVYRSERATGDRNRALAYLMRNAGSLPGDVDEVLDVYFRQCSLLVTAGDLATMAATLANGGTNPATGEEVVAESVAEQVMATMASCGMYDGAGEWMLRVGLPAKSGVAGGIIAVSPGQFGIGVFSPPLDERGNSVRGVEACRTMSTAFSLHLLHRTRPTAPVVTVDESGATTVLALHGDLEFAAAERALSVVDPLLVRWSAEGGGCLLVDLEGVTRAHPAAVALVDAVVRWVQGHGGLALAVDPAGRHLLVDVADELPSVDAARARALSLRRASR